MKMRPSRWILRPFGSPSYSVTRANPPLGETRKICPYGMLVVPALAQTPPPDGTPTRIRGTVEKLDGQNLAVKSRDGQSLTVVLAPNFTVSTLVKKSIGDIKPNDYVASTGVKGTDGKLHAVE